MYCSQCGKPAQGKFCSHCGAPLMGAPFADAGVAVATAPGPVGNWENEVRYEALVQIPHIRATIERHAGMAKKRLSGEEFLQFSQKFMPGSPPLDKMASMVQPLYAK